MNFPIRKVIKKLLMEIKQTQSRILTTIRPEERKLIYTIQSQNLTYLSNHRLASIAQSCRLIESGKLPGGFIEAGCALGGSTILISYIKQHSRPLYVYDVFATIPPPTEQDGVDVQRRYQIINKGKSKGIGGDKYYGYEHNLDEIVSSNLRQFGIDEKQLNIYLIKGLLQETMKIDQSVAFAHIDVDWYEPTKTCLERIVPKLIPGGCIIIDDYHDWSGCRKATDEFFKGNSQRFLMDDSAGSMKITRKK